MDEREKHKQRMMNAMAAIVLAAQRFSHGWRKDRVAAAHVNSLAKALDEAVDAYEML